jgi:phosphohistidine phosphatase SixA
VPAEIYIFRHGIEAEQPEPPGLSGEGVARVRRQARGLSWLGVHLDLILAGTDIASRETAAALAGELLPSPRVIETSALGPEGSADAALQEVWDTSDIRVAVVGCEPIVGLLAARLIGALHPLIFKKAGGCRIDVDAGNRCGRLRWFLPPKILREMGRWA